MNKLFRVVFILLSLSAGTVAAQQKAEFSKLSFNPLFTTTSSSQVSFLKNTDTIYTPKAPSLSLHYTLPTGAIFCRMEDALYKHFNFWIKFRMGSDDRYSN